MKKTIFTAKLLLKVVLLLVLLAALPARAQLGPAVSQDLTNELGAIGGSANFAVGVSGTAPFTYQWFFDGAPLPNLIATIAGNGTAGYTGDGGPGTNAQLNGPYAVAVDALGDVFIADQLNNVVREVGANGIIMTVAGNGSSGYSGDGGAATNAMMDYPDGVAVDTNGNLFIGSIYNYAVREVSANGIITTVAGNGTYGYSGDGGPATNANLSYVGGVAVDAYGNLFIADTHNYVVRKVDTNGIITTVAGSGGYGFLGDGGAATNAQFEIIQDVAVDASGNLYIADRLNNRIRMVNTNGIVNTIAGGGTNGLGDGGAATNASLSDPTAVAVDVAGNIFIADTSDNRIREVNTNGIITTVAGDGLGLYAGDGGFAVNAALNGPWGVAVDSSDNVYIADTGNNAVRKVFANTTSNLSLYNLVAADSGSYDVIISNNFGSATSSIVTLSVGQAASVVAQPQNVTIGAGSNATFAVTASGTAPLYYQWLFNGSPLAGQTASNLTIAAAAPTNAGSYSIVVSNIYSATTSSAAKLTVLLIVTQPQSKSVPVGTNVTLSVTTTATAAFTYQWYFDGMALPGQTSSALTFNPVAFTNGGSYQVVVSNNLYGAATSSDAVLTVGYPPTIAVEPQSQPVLFGDGVALSVTVAGTGPFTYQWQDNGTNISNLSNNIITTVAGTGSATYNGDNIPATNASINEPLGVTVDSYGNLFIADSNNRRVRQVGTDGIITTIAGPGTNQSFLGDGGPATNAYLNTPLGVAVDSSGNVFVTDFEGNRVRKISTSGIISTFAGNGQDGYNSSIVVATNTPLNGPAGIVIDSEDNLLIADDFNMRVREVEYGVIFPVAGGGFADPGNGGLAASAELDEPTSVAVDVNENIYIADTSFNRIQMVNGSGIINTLAGTGIYNFSGDGGVATNATVAYPHGVAVDASGNVFIADTYNNRIRRIATNGIITTVAGGGNGYINFGDGGPATNATLDSPNGIAVDAYGNLFIADSYHSKIRKVVFQGPTIFLTSSNLAQASNYDVVITGAFGSVTSSVATITTAFAPGIAAEPQSQVATAGSTVTFSVTASGTAPFFYQWYFNGGPLSGQTSNTLVLKNVSSNSAGDYQVVVANPYASVNSSMAALAIVASTLSSPPPVSAGGSVSLGVTVYGGGPLTYQWQVNGTNLPISTITTIAGTNFAGGLGDGGPATSAALDGPNAVTLDSLGNIYIADTLGNRIRKIGTNGIIRTMAGTGAYGYGGDAGQATNAPLENPYGVTVDASENIYIADTFNNRIRKVGTNGIISTIAGKSGSGFSGDGGPATNALLTQPYSVAVDAYGNVFFADLGNSRIREIATNGIINTVAGGSSFEGFSGDGGPAVDAGLALPRGVSIDFNGNIFVADTQNSRIREIAVNQIINTVAGKGNFGYSGDLGAATNAYLFYPGFAAADYFGDLFIADTHNNRIREVGANGIINTVAGNGSTGYSGDGVAAISAAISSPGGVAVDSSGNLYIADTSNNRIRKVTLQGPTLLLTNIGANSAGSYEVVVTSSHGSVTSSVVNLTVLLPPQNLAASVVPGEGALVQFNGTPTNAYVLQTTTNLTPPIQWQALVTNLTDANGNWSFIDTSAVTNAATFYRAMLP